MRGSLLKKMVNAALVTGSVLVGLAAVEIFFRLADLPEAPPEKQYVNFFQSLQKLPHPFYPGYDGKIIAYNYYIYRPGAVWATAYPDNPRGYFDADNRVYYQCNAQGFRDREFTDKKRDAFRIIAIGDSFTMGEGVRAEDTYPRLLEKRLNARGVKADVYNLGVNGHGIRDEMVTLTTALDRYHPDMILWGYVLNDISHAMFDQWVIQMNRDRRRILVTDSPFLFFNYLQRRLWKWYESLSYMDFVRNMYERPDFVRDLEALFAKAGSAASDAGIPVLVIIFPDLDALQKDSYPFAMIHKQLSDMFDRLGIPWIDLTRLYKNNDPATLKVHPVDGHPNEKAQALAADSIDAWLEKHPSLLLYHTP